MEEIEGAPLQFSVATPVEEALKKAVSLMHKNGNVHGDLVIDNTAYSGFRLGWKVSQCKISPRIEHGL